MLAAAAADTCKCRRHQPRLSGLQSHNDAEAPGFLPLLWWLVRISLHHLPDEILEYILDLPVLLG